MNDLNSHQINVIKNLEPVSSKISTDRPLVNQVTKESNLISNAKNLDLNRNFNAFPLVQAHRLKNPKNVIIGHLNVNSLRKKFTAVEESIKGKTDIGLISETKIDESFPNHQFKINGYKTIRRDRDSFGGDLIFYINEQVPSKVLTLESIPRDIEIILLDFTVKKQKWLCIGLNKPPSQNEKYFLDHLSKALGRLTYQYDKTILIGDFNFTAENNNLENFMKTFNLECLIKKPACFQSSNQRCIDLILTKKERTF